MKWAASLARLYREEVIHLLVRLVPFISSFTTVGEDLNWPTLVALIEVVFGTPCGIHKRMSKNAEVVCLMLVHFRMVYRWIFSSLAARLSPPPRVCTRRRLASGYKIHDVLGRLVFIKAKTSAYFVGLSGTSRRNKTSEVC